MAVNNSVLASALRRRQKGYVDSVTSHILIFEWLRMKNRYISTDGGTALEFEAERILDTDEHSYADFDTIIIAPQNAVVNVLAQWKQYAAPIVISGEERRKNTGPTRIFNLMEQKERNALNSIQSQLNVDLYLDGTGNNSKKITGLAAVFQETPATGTLFGIDRSGTSGAFFRNRSVGPVGTSLNMTTKESNMADDMHTGRIEAGRLRVGGAAHRYPDFGICTEQYFQWYEKVLQITGMRFRNTDMGDIGFDNLAYHGMTIFHDEDMPQDDGGDEKIYMLNSEFMELRYHPQANFTPTGLDRHTNQEVFSGLIIWMGELLPTVPAKMAIVHGATAPTAS